MTGWCRLWIMNYGLIAKPLYEAQKNSPFVWGPQQQKAFVELKRALMSAPALGLPDLTKDFYLFVHERQHLALGVLTQKIGSWKRPVGYFSKQLDTVSRGWPNCLQAVAATVMLIQEARKLTLGRTITVYVPHMVITVLEQKGGHWLSPSRMMKYQAVLTEQDDVILKTTNLVNPAVFLSSIQEEGQLEHDCLATIEYVYSSHEDLKDVPLERPDWELYTDGSSFMEQGVRYSGYAVTTETTVIEAGALGSTTSAQKAELIALIRALELRKTLTAIRSAVIWNRPLSLENSVHDFQPGDYVYVKTWTSEPLQERWRGPFQILLTTFTAIKISESDAWIHYTRVKKTPTPWKIVNRDPETLKLTLKHV
ncbi:uncharacterized protein LOC119140745 [Falco rusticolus]|uniref:uncharacterized protein LOC119140745 n=1 Tax=Falco rusticolus TaxID=120794 RepID=UPI0018868208|nr:uncharacterized protein LOC119140745 [Falco rusticolus]